MTSQHFESIAKRVALVWLNFFLIYGVLITTTTEAKPQVLLISFDGFRWDYLHNDFRTKYKLDLPNFDKLQAMGVYAAEGNIAPFHTKTFPSHYTAATGLYVESHGIVSNHFYDKKLKKLFKKSYRDLAWWNQGEPIWITAKKQNLRSGTYFWPGSEVDWNGIKPDHQMEYDESVPFEKRIKSSIEWLHEGIDLVVSYYHEPDKTGHHYGPDSREVADKVKEMDGVLGKIMEAIESSNKLKNNVNVLLTSDHGFYQISQEKSISLNEYLSVDDAIIPTTGSIVYLIPKQSTEEQILQKLEGVEHVAFYKREDIPEEYHYRDNDRIAPVVGFPDLGWMVFPNASKFPWETNRGNHGWSNKNPEMRPIFLAYGPAFKKNLKVESFETVNYYPLMCHLLNITPSPNNGSLENVEHLLSKRLFGRR